ncbi:DSD1 family PLP-dependent enzyme [Paraburkholderia sp. RP-4-7]|jgi:D-serine deaminase-like pyridoxal phosphate-dependent protein|uniref:DSD1 family PLP-dependent enzyme n=1 Tax=Paraburkholderia polaris TaxID=2728848 RepID=A0A848I9V2_9BURK|nr:DSD1 family PLP-dependent enzyme [Paraburkholderia polaris]NML99081.1 DSD1 family PLP-dependent enzyme [Paraburkholderia polaris]
MSSIHTIQVPPAASPGNPITTIDTPALLLDADAFERNLDVMQARADAAGVALRPHAKAHKCPAIALAQIQRGAVGICCQKVSEALPFLQAGVTDIHISNEVIGSAKLDLLARMARHARFSVCVDHPDQVVALAAATTAHGSRIDVFVEINVGQNRCGVADARQVLQLLEVMSAHAQLTFKGLQAYQGGIQHIRDHAGRRDASGLAAARTAEVVDALDRAGVVCAVVTGGGSGSVEFDLASGVYTEVQPGSYVFMDGDYARNVYTNALRFEHSLFLATSVISVGNSDAGQVVVVDAGLKSLAVDSGLPTVWGDGGASTTLHYTVVNDEHGSVQMLNHDVAKPALGSQLLLVPGHCDPTLNLHDEIIVVRGGRVEVIWPVSARGHSR